MDLQQIVVLVLQISIIAMVFGFGLKATPDDLLYLWRRPGLLLRSLVAMLVVMPIVAVFLVWTFDFPRPSESCWSHLPSRQCRRSCPTESGARAR